MCSWMRYGPAVHTMSPDVLCNAEVCYNACSAGSCMVSQRVRYVVIAQTRAITHADIAVMMCCTGRFGTHSHRAVEAWRP